MGLVECAYSDPNCNWALGRVTGGLKDWKVQRLIHHTQPHKPTSTCALIGGRRETGHNYNLVVINLYNRWGQVSENRSSIMGA